MSVLDLVERQYRNAAARSVRRVVLELPAVLGVSAACTKLFADIDREDDKQKAIARQVWLLRTTILQTLLSFGDQRLGLATLAADIQLAGEAVPAIAAPAAKLAELAIDLVSGVPNPKREWLRTFINERAGTDTPIGVLAKLQAGTSPGWPPGVAAGPDFGHEGLALIRTRKDGREHTFSHVVVPGTLRFAARPLAHDLLYGGRTAEVILLVYRSERVYVPLPLDLPVDGLFKRRPVAEEGSTDNGGSDPDAPLDRWANESFWTEIRAQHADAVPLSESDVTVSARFVLFGDGTGAFLPDDRTVIELAGLLDSGGPLDISEDRLPRKSVRELEERDVILLRLKGGGHYVDDVADSLMARAGLPLLRNEATEWKAWLHAALKRHGEGVVAKYAREAGVKLRSATYLWVWAGDAVIAPHDFQTFNALIAALHRLDGQNPGLMSAEYARKKWEKMEHLKAFHHRAGIEIRAALLQRVKELVSARQQVEATVSIELPGLEAGRMGLLRVAAVDNETMRIPMSRLYQIHTVGHA